MTKNISKFAKISITVLALLLFGAAGAAVYAAHSWGPYHWARSSNPFTLKLGDNVSSAWDPYLLTASNDWSQSSVLNTAVVSGSTNPKPCKATNGRVQVCSSRYGFSGWLGTASIWVSGTHIVKGTVKMNDSYFNTSTYNIPAWRQSVICQELGHTLGLDHQDENFNNAPLGTCMDYSADPTPNQHPNQHDYDQLVLIYAHLDGFNSYNMMASGGSGGNKGDTDKVQARDKDDLDALKQGKSLRTDMKGRTSVFESDLGGGDKLITFVFFKD